MNNQVYRVLQDTMYAMWRELQQTQHVTPRKVKGKYQNFLFKQSPQYASTVDIYAYTDSEKQLMYVGAINQLWGSYQAAKQAYDFLSEHYTWGGANRDCPEWGVTFTNNKS